MRKTRLSLACLLALTACAFPVHSQQLAIVVGIDHYSPKTANLPTLLGAVNDAKLLQSTLREIGVDLPDSRVLINENATVGHFQAAWEEVLAQARPGDRIIVTFAGHGSQEKDQAPFDEKDGLDETLLFYDYDPAGAGRISDDTLYALFQKASAYSILFVSDSCHAGGMTRGLAASALLPSRDGDGLNDMYKVDLDSRPKLTGSSDGSHVLEHVTYLNATDQDALKIHEILAPGPAKQPHGALSVAFAEAIAGQADADGNHMVSRKELADYVQKRVKVLSDQQQIPGLLPRSGEETALALNGAQAQSTPAPQAEPLRVWVKGGAVPTGVEGIQLSQDAYRLRFDISGDKANVINTQGDLVAEIPARDGGAWNKLVAKYQFLNALDGNVNLAKNAVEISLDKGGKLHHLKERLQFSFDPKSPRKHMLLFDLAGNGETQFLYPEKTDPAAVDKIPYTLPLNVAEPIGEDDVVAVFCEKPNAAAVALLNAHAGKNPPPVEAFFQVLGDDCQVGRYAFFTDK